MSCLTDQFSKNIIPIFLSNVYAIMIQVRCGMDKSLSLWIVMPQFYTFC